MVSYTVGDSGFLFVETEVFTACVRVMLDDETLRTFQNELLLNPTKGVVMQGCGGLRKARVEESRRGKGKRSGARVIYLYIPEANRIDLVAIYSKDERDDLSARQKSAMKKAAEAARREALVWSRKQRSL